ncbi:MAG: flagellar basal body P-ring formation chaperone FlgA [Pseudomonadota bacterium]
MSTHANAAASRWQGPRDSAGRGRRAIRALAHGLTGDARPALGLAARVATLTGLVFALATVLFQHQAQAQTHASVIPVSTALPQVGAYASLRASTVVRGPVVTLGDLVTGAGAAAETPVFMAPEPGLVGYLDAGLVRDAALRAGLSGIDSNGLAAIEVRRFGTMMEASAAEAALREELANRLGASSGEALDIAFDNGPEAAAVEEEARPRVADLAISGDRFEATVELGSRTQRLTGRVGVRVPALVLTRQMGRGEVLEMSDLAFAEIPRPRHGQAVPAPEEAIGFAVTRGLKAGDALLAADLMRPVVMERGAPVTLVHRTGRMILTARGSALKSARIGDIIEVLNTQSRRIVQARVTGPQEAEALGSGSARPARISMR